MSRGPQSRPTAKQFRDKDVARRWLVHMDAEAHGAMFSQPTNADRPRPFREVIDVWKETCWTGLSPSTTARYGQVLRTYLEPEFGSTPIADVNRGTCRRYFAQLTREGKAPGAVRKVHTVLSAIMSEEVELNIIAANPCTRMRGLPTVRHQEPVFLNAEQVRTLAEAMPTDTYKLLVYTAAYTGLRSGELCALRRKDVDPARCRSRAAGAEAARPARVRRHQDRQDAPTRNASQRGSRHLINAPGPRAGPLVHAEVLLVEPVKLTVERFL